MGYFQSFWLFIWGYIKQSFVYKILRKVYDGISGAWKRSRITNFFRNQHFSSDVLGNGAAARILRSPFTFFAWLQRKYCEKLKNKIETSCISAELILSMTFLKRTLQSQTDVCGLQP